jgi:hypothetical protein
VCRCGSRATTGTSLARNDKVAIALYRDAKREDKDEDAIVEWATENE